MMAEVMKMKRFFQLSPTQFGNCASSIRIGGTRPKTVALDRLRTFPPGKIAVRRRESQIKKQPARDKRR
jgi:hypothetical protein